MWVSSVDFFALRLSGSYTPVPSRAALDSKSHRRQSNQRPGVSNEPTTAGAVAVFRERCRPVFLTDQRRGDHLFANRTSRPGGHTCKPLVTTEQVRWIDIRCDGCPLQR